MRIISTGSPKETGVKPVVDQIEMHPYFAAARQARRPADARKTSRSSAIHRWGMATCSRTSWWRKSAKRAWRKSVAQAVIRWHLQMGHIAIPRSTNAGRLKENFDVFDFELTPDEMRQMESLDKGEAGRTGSDPATASFLF